MKTAHSAGLNAGLCQATLFAHLRLDVGHVGPVLQYLLQG